MTIGLEDKEEIEKNDFECDNIKSSMALRKVSKTTSEGERESIGVPGYLCFCSKGKTGEVPFRESSNPKYSQPKRRSGQAFLRWPTAWQ